jgi:hypothetical protein
MTLTPWHAQLKSLGILGVFSLGCLANPLQAQVAEEIASLAGLRPLYPNVVPLSGTARGAGLSTEALLARLEARLREASIATLAPGDTAAYRAPENARKPLLTLTVTVLDIQGGWTAMVSLDLRQNACVPHPPAESGILCYPFKTWTEARIITSGLNELPAYLRAALDEQLDKFVMHYARANPEAP